MRRCCHRCLPVCAFCAVIVPLLMYHQLNGCRAAHSHQQNTLLTLARVVLPLTNADGAG